MQQRPIVVEVVEQPEATPDISIGSVVLGDVCSSA